jgi:hypothetical protein
MVWLTPPPGVRVFVTHPTMESLREAQKAARQRKRQLRNHPHPKETSGEQ